MADGARLGIVDWGIGGLGLLGRLDEAVPSLPVTYWSDTGSTPYGLVPAAELAARLTAVVAGLAARGCTEVVLACNAASTVADRLAHAAVPVEGIIDHGIAAAAAAVERVDRRPAWVGVVGGRATIRSQRYQRGLGAAGVRATGRVAQPLSAHIEAGRTGSPAFAADLARIVAPLRGADAVVLACTHYPVAARWFAAELPGTALVDPVAGVADTIAARHAGRATVRGDRTFLTTGAPAAMQEAAELAWHRRIDHVERVAP